MSAGRLLKGDLAGPCDLVAPWRSWFAAGGTELSGTLHSGCINICAREGRV